MESRKVILVAASLAIVVVVALLALQLRQDIAPHHERSDTTVSIEDSPSGSDVHVDDSPESQSRQALVSRSDGRTQLHILLADGTPVEAEKAEVEYWSGSNLSRAPVLEQVAIHGGNAKLSAMVDQPLTLKRLRIGSATLVSFEALKEPLVGVVHLTVHPQEGVVFVAVDSQGEPVAITECTAALQAREEFSPQPQVGPMRAREFNSEAAHISPDGYVGTVPQAEHSRHSAAIVVVNNSLAAVVPVYAAELGLEVVATQRVVRWEIRLNEATATPFKTFDVYVASDEVGAEGRATVVKPALQATFWCVPAAISRVVVTARTPGERDQSGGQFRAEVIEDLSTGASDYITEIDVEGLQPLATLRVRVSPPQSGLHEEHVHRNPKNGRLTSLHAFLTSNESELELGDVNRTVAETELRMTAEGVYEGEFGFLYFGRYELRLHELGMVMDVKVETANRVVDVALAEPSVVVVEIVDSETGEPVNGLVGCQVCPFGSSAGRRLGGLMLMPSQGGRASFRVYQGTAFVSVFAEGYGMAAIERDLAYASDTVVAEMRRCPTLRVRVNSQDGRAISVDTEFAVEAFYTEGSARGRACVLRRKATSIGSGYVDWEFEADLEGEISLSLVFPESHRMFRREQVQLVSGIDNAIEIAW